MKSTGEVMGVDRTLPAALRKAFQAAGMALRPGGSVLLTIADTDQAEMFPIVSRLTQLGCRIYATAGTAGTLRRAGFSPQVVGKIGEGGQTVIDVISDGSVDMVINTMTGVSDEIQPGRPVIRDGFEIRRAAVERRIPCLTSLDTAAALVESAWHSNGSLEVRTITEWREGAA